MNLFLSCTGRVSFRELNRSVTDPHSLHCPHPIGLCKVSCRAASETVIELRRLPARTRVPGGGGLWCMRSIAFWNCSADIALSMASIAGSGGGPRCPVPRQEIPCGGLQGVPGFRTRRLRDTFAVELLTHSGVQTTERYYAPRDRSRRDLPTPNPGGQIRFERTSPRFKGIYGLPTMVC